MMALLWKDYRLNRFVLIAGTAIFLGPYAVLGGVQAYMVWQEPGVPMPMSWPEVFALCTLLSAMLSCLTMALVGGNAMACERPDRSAEFLAYLPPTRRKILASKLLLAVMVGAVVWGLNASVAAFLLKFADRHHALEGFVTVGAIMLLVFGASWLGSAVLASPGSAGVLGIGVTVFMAATAAYVSSRFGLADVESAIAWTGLVGGTACLVGGTVWYLCRTEP